MPLAPEVARLHLLAFPIVLKAHLWCLLVGPGIWACVLGTGSLLPAPIWAGFGATLSLPLPSWESHSKDQPYASLPCVDTPREGLVEVQFVVNSRGGP